jgi:hypothetical protein
VGWVFFLVFVIFVVLDAGIVASLWVQRSAETLSPSGGSYQVRLLPTGVRWVSWSWLTGSWLSATAEWVRYLRTRRTGWTVAVVSRTARSAPSLYSEQFSDWSAARRRVADLASEIGRGIVGLNA